MGIRCWIRRFVLKKSSIERGHGCRPVGHSNPRRLQQCSELPPTFAADTTIAFEMALCGWQTFLLLHWRHSLLKQFSTFRAKNSNVSSKEIPIIPGRICTTNLLSSKVACADEPRKSFHTEVPGLQATQCKPGKPAPYYSVRQSTDLLIGKTLSAPRVI